MPIVLGVVGLIVLVLATWWAQHRDSLDAFAAFAAVGTAAGTLGLALYTYRLAQSTQESVRESGQLTALSLSQLEEIKAQRDLLTEQAREAAIQAEATRRLADASEISAQEAAKARIDAVSPLVLMELALGEIMIREQGGDARALTAEDRWYEPQLRGKSVSVALSLSLRNLGKSPARVAFNYTTQNLQPWRSSAHPAITLKPGQIFEDSLVVWFPAAEASHGRLIEVAVTYDGIIHGEVFDHVQWNGWVTPMKTIDGEVVRNEERWIINAGGASVVRSYPNLERPEELAEARERLMNPRAQLAGQLSPDT